MAHGEGICDLHENIRVICWCATVLGGGIGSDGRLLKDTPLRGAQSACAGDVNASS